MRNNNNLNNEKVHFVFALKTFIWQYPLAM